MNDYLCAVLLNIETYKQASKYNDLGCGDTSKIPKALVDACSITGAFFINRFHSIVRRMTPIKSSLFAMLFTSYKLKRIKQKRPYILTVKGIKPDTNWTLLNRWKRVFWNLLPAISQNLHTKLTLHRNMVRQISFLYLLGVRGWNLFFDLQAPKSSLPEINVNNRKESR